jgi:hypothetical protein
MIVQGDMYPILQGYLIDGHGRPVDLTGATVQVKFKKADATIVTASPTVVDAPGGVVQYAWGATDTSAIGAMSLVFIVSRAGALQTYPVAAPLVITVIAALA